MQGGSRLERVIEGVYLHRDTCNVWVIDEGDGLVVIHSGNGSVTRSISETFQEKPILGVMNTHHFRPSVQGLPMFEKAGIDIFVPYWEQDMFAGTTALWQERQTWNNYDGRWDRYSPITSVNPTGYLMDYSTKKLGNLEFLVIPAPGPTCGGIALKTCVHGKEIVFTGDLIYGPGKVWNLASSQWNYNDAYGLCNWFWSLERILKQSSCVDVILPCHGKPMFSPIEAIELLQSNIKEVLAYRARPEELYNMSLEGEDLKQISDHLYLDMRSMANTYYLISDSGKAMAIDYGYRLPMLVPGKYHFSTRRPLLHGIEALQEKFGIGRIDVVIPSHVHDDHVCGIPLLKRLFATELWCAKHFADVLEKPYAYNIQCLWPESMHVDRRLLLLEEFQWEEYSFRLHPAGAHTFYSACLEFEVDGRRVVHTGDQQGFANMAARDDGFLHNYVYQNRFRREEMKRAAEMIEKVGADLIISGHWDMVDVTKDLINTLKLAGAEQLKIHESLLPTSELDWDDSIGATIYPYNIEIRDPKRQAKMKVCVHNPFRKTAMAEIKMVVPKEWSVNPCVARVLLEPLAKGIVWFNLSVPENTCVRRTPVCADVTIDKHMFGQIAEALVTVNWPERTQWGGGVWNE